MTMGENIKKARKQKGYTQEYVALTLGVSRQAVYKWEKGLAKPDTTNLIKLADLLGTTVDQLISVDPEAVPQASAPNVTPLYRTAWLLILFSNLAYWAGVFSGILDEMGTIPLPGGLRFGIWWLWYGDSFSAALVLAFAIILLLNAFLLFVIAFSLKKK